MFVFIDFNDCMFFFGFVCVSEVVVYVLVCLIGCGDEKVVD